MLFQVITPILERIYSSLLKASAYVLKYIFLKNSKSQSATTPNEQYEHALIWCSAMHFDANELPHTHYTPPPPLSNHAKKYKIQSKCNLEISLWLPQTLYLINVFLFFSKGRSQWCRQKIFYLKTQLISSIEEDW